MNGFGRLRRGSAVFDCRRPPPIVLMAADSRRSLEMPARSVVGGRLLSVDVAIWILDPDLHRRTDRDAELVSSVDGRPLSQAEQGLEHASGQLGFARCFRVTEPLAAQLRSHEVFEPVCRRPALTFRGAHVVISSLDGVRGPVLRCATAAWPRGIFRGVGVVGRVTRAPLPNAVDSPAGMGLHHGWCFVLSSGSLLALGGEAPIHIDSPRARQSSSARSIVGRCPPRISDRNAPDGSRASRAASSAVRFCRASSARISSHSRSVAERFTACLRVISISSTHAQGSGSTWHRRRRPWPRPSEVFPPSSPAGACRFRLTRSRAVRRGGAADSCSSRRPSRSSRSPASLASLGFRPFLRDNTLRVCARMCYRDGAHADDRTTASPDGTHDGHPARGPAGGSMAMADAHVLLASFRDELTMLQSRRADLREQLEVLDRNYERLETTIAVLSERVGVAVGAGPADEVEPVPLTDRIVDALGVSGLQRREMLRLFEPQGFTASAVDSAANRLVKKGLVRRQGRRIVLVVPASETAEPVAPDSGSVRPSSPAAPAVRDSARVPVHESGADPQPVDPGPEEPRVRDDDDRPLARRVRDAVEAGVDTRKELVRFFESRGVKGPRPVTRAIWDLRRRGVLTVDAGKLAVAAAGVGDGSSSGVDTGSVSRL